MKSFLLAKVAEEIRKHRKIVRALRVDENLIFLQLDRDRFYFDLTRGESGVYINIDYPLVRRFSAPFDRLLERLFTRAQIVGVEQWERFLVIKGVQQSSFKKVEGWLRFEFTGRHTNAIILNPDGVVLEALRHITPEQSRRVVLPGVKLEEPPPREIREKQFPVENLEEWTQQEFHRKYQRKLEQLKRQGLKRLEKKEREIRRKLAQLGSEEEWQERGERYRKWGELLLANLHQIGPHQREVEVVDWDGTPVKIPIPELPNLNRVGEHYFKLARKAFRKGENLHIQRRHLQQQLEFLKNYRRLIETSDQIGTLRRYLPTKRRGERDSQIEKLEIDGFPVWIGKSEEGNKRLLKEAKGEDLWFHIRNHPGPHLILKTQKRSVPMEVIKEVAKLAVQFAGKEEGVVDYTRRKFVKVKEGAKVEYGKYSSIKVKPTPKG
jgi:predicted ribosome quality control (RQC) complex YloA/Tae2 family protein